MVAKTLLRVAALAGLTFAAPHAIEKRANIDTTILNFALTLEYLEKSFYSGALQNFTLQDFEKAGYSADYYNNLRHIAYDEAQHVSLLMGALGSQATQPCMYSFPYTDVPSFITLSSVLEGVGTSAYLGAAPLITNKQYLTVAGAILAVEALHTSLQRDAIGEVPNANPLYTPLDGNSVYTLAAMFITSCPASNPALPFKSFPALQADGETCTCEEPECGSPSEFIKKRWGRKGEGWPKTWHHGMGECSVPTVGQNAMFTAKSDIPANSYVTFVSGLTVTSVKGSIDGMSITAKIPSGIAGQAYAFVTKSDVEGTFSDTEVLFGPAIVEVKPASV